MTRAFVIRPFGAKKDSAGNAFDFERIHARVIGPALEEAGLPGSTTGEIIEAGNIREDMFALILTADLVICDITLPNANVFYELGIRHALRRKSTILIKHIGSADAPPFDLLTDRYLSYDVDDPGAKAKLLRSIAATLNTEAVTDSPIFKLLPELREADPTSRQFVPLDLREEIARARAAESKGWLRLLSQEVRDRPFECPALEVIAQGQYDLKDYSGARDTFERIRQGRPDHVNANLALANIYERLFRNRRRQDLIAASDQAIDRVLSSTGATGAERTEALALRGRNRKTQWRLSFEDLATLEERRAAATSEALRGCLEAYRVAFARDLNHYWSGLAALQMATIFIELSEQGNEWKRLFDDDVRAEQVRGELIRNLEALRHVVSASIESAGARFPVDHRERVWADLSKADLLFLTDTDDVRVVRRYADAIPRSKPFVWDAARGQLQLFASLGIRTPRAEAVIAELDRRLGTLTSLATSPPHIVLFAGHRVDEPGRTTARFPPGQVELAKDLIRRVLADLLDAKGHFVGLASAAPGGDILFHEVCAELGVRSIPCLPMPRDRYASLTFDVDDEWRSRFFAVVERAEPLELSDRDGLPRWLRGSVVDSWERGNRWVLQMALAAEAERITLLALWDGLLAGDGPGGTAHFVQLARQSGKVDVKRIDSGQLVRAHAR